MSDSILNLSSSPFLNRRQVERFRLVFWLLGAVLLALSLNSYLRNLRDSTDLRSNLRELDAEIEAVTADIEGLEATLAELGPAEQNNRVLFLNQQIAERTFPWGELFDDIGEVLPRDVRLRSLDPRVARPGLPGTRGARDTERRVGLALRGVARSDRSVYEFVDALFAHRRFSSPELSYERRQDNGQVNFSLAAGYLPLMGREPVDEVVATETPEEGS